MDPYDLGYEARMTGVKKTANPYRIDIDDERWTAWMNGWEDANDDLAEEMQ